jgi:hypothetical protein
VFLALAFCPASPTTGISHPICYDNTYLPWLCETLLMISKLFRINGKTLFNSYLPSGVVGDCFATKPSARTRNGDGWATLKWVQCQEHQQGQAILKEIDFSL